MIDNGKWDIVETQQYSTRRADILSHITRTAGTSWSDSARVRVPRLHAVTIACYAKWVRLQNKRIGLYHQTTICSAQMFYCTQKIMHLIHMQKIWTHTTKEGNRHAKYMATEYVYTRANDIEIVTQQWVVCLILDTWGPNKEYYRITIRVGDLRPTDHKEYTDTQKTVQGLLLTQEQCKAIICNIYNGTQADRNITLKSPE